MSLDKIRLKIDNTDKKIVQLLNKRMNLSLKVAEIKSKEIKRRLHMGNYSSELFNGCHKSWSMQQRPQFVLDSNH